MKRLFFSFLFGLAFSAVVQADCITADLSTAIKAYTGSSDSTTATEKYINIGSGCSILEADAADTTGVSFEAYRIREVSPFSSFDESIIFSKGICKTALNFGDRIDASLDFDGGTVFSAHDGINPNDNTYSLSSGYYAFRVSAGVDIYYYGWVQLDGVLATSKSSWNPAVPDKNSAMVEITSMGMQDTAGYTIDAGTVVPEPASVLLIGLGGLLIAGYRRIKEYMA